MSFSINVIKNQTTTTVTLAEPKNEKPGLLSKLTPSLVFSVLKKGLSITLALIGFFYSGTAIGDVAKIIQGLL